MTTAKRTALVVCPGRGVYNASELGYYASHHPDKKVLMGQFDAQRMAAGQLRISELDSAERYSVSKFTRGDNASGLIYACSYADFITIDPNQFDVVAVTGNSMGWYTTLACAGALTAEDGFRTVNTMGTIMQEQLIGQQIIYPIIDEDWKICPDKRDRVLRLVSDTDGLFVSIWLGGMIVLAGTEKAIKTAETELEPTQNRFPMKLANHAAFHTPLLRSNSEAGSEALNVAMFKQPAIPMVDGRGHIWSPAACDLQELWNYTFGAQVIETYDFTRAIQTGLREFAPDCVIVLGPGNTLGGATAQCMIDIEWQDLKTKTDFASRQTRDPYLLAMGNEAQRKLTV